MNYIRISVLFLIFLLSSISVNADFREIEADFDRYREKIEEDFRKYRSILDEEFTIYKNSIKMVWGEAQTSSRTKFVEYSKDYSIKREVDFENNRIVISVKTDSSLNPDLFREELVDLLKESGGQAFKRNSFLSSSEERLQTAGLDVMASDSIDNAKIIGDAVTGKKDADNADIRNTTLDLLKKARVKTSHPDLSGKKVVSITIFLPHDTLKKKASLYQEDVEVYSAKRGLNPSLVFAVMHTESTFNPMAKSEIPAYGLMQVVPGTAGRDATKLMYGRSVLLAPSYLYNPRKNIRVGAAYLSVLFTKYMKRIKDPLSRMYCVIAAYNTGASNVGRAFINVSSLKKALPVINSMSPEEVFSKLIADLPKKETRNYLKKVVKRMEFYKTR